MSWRPRWWVKLTKCRHPNEEKEQDVPPETDGLRSQYFSEKVIIDTFVTAGTGALTRADGIAEKVVTAAFSVATAYTAVIALVAPKDSVSPPLVIAPFILFAAAIVLALMAQSVQLQLEPATNDVREISRRVQTSTRSKRDWGYGGLAALTLGLVIAGLAIYETYGPGADEKDTAIDVEIWLTPAGTRLVGAACGNVANPLVGEVADADSLSSGTVALEVTKAGCRNGAGTLVLPRRAIGIAKQTSD
jgi:hypothetical protein